MKLKNIASGVLAAACLVAGTTAHADNTIVVNLDNVGNQQTDLLDMLMSFHQFDASLGQLTGVTLDVYSHVSTTVDLDNYNTGPFGAKTLNVGIGASMSVSAPFSATLSASGTLLESPLSVGAKTLNTPGHASSSDDTTLHATYTYSANDLQAFVGNGSLASHLTVTAGSGLQANNIDADYDTWANGYGHVTYTFAALPVPEPETYGMLLMGLGLVAFVAKRSKRVA